MTRDGDREDRSSRSAAAFTGLVLALVFAVIVLAGLGLWQVERRTWKLGLIDQIDTRIHAAPAPVPGPEDWSGIGADKDAYRHVQAVGSFLDVPPTFTQATTALGGGYWVLSPLKTHKGFVVLVNRGFVLPGQRGTVGNAFGPAEVTGLLRVSEPEGGFLHSNDPSDDRWYSRDVDAIAQKRGLKDVAPYFIDADKGSPDAVPVGGLTVVDLPNNHFVYALTWFALAIMAVAGLVFLIRDERKARRG
ncbi:SURF1-like protein [Labrys miyagiensis]|uniref:SURF1-like protein n=1 Tax=Labrys miyagiensis TaxID=346912 RepID=A0ABQ6CLW8_9HYPH|nr:SURF1 family protein [Labrys miyagiensis]GLS20820.1 SURF1-like protein [Labrys miyagiensis]